MANRRVVILVFATLANTVQGRRVNSATEAKSSTSQMRPQVTAKPPAEALVSMLLAAESKDAFKAIAPPQAHRPLLARSAYTPGAPASRSSEPQLIIGAINPEMLKSALTVVASVLRSSAGMSTDPAAFKDALAIVQASMDPENFQTVLAAASQVLTASVDDFGDYTAPITGLDTFADTIALLVGSVVD